MSNFAWIGYYPNIASLNKLFKFAKMVRGSIDEQTALNRLKRMSAVEIANFTAVSVNGNQAIGSILLAPLLLRQIPALKKETILEKINAAIEIARKKDCKVICLAGAFGDFAKDVNPGITKGALIVTGKNMLTSTLLNTILRASELNNVNYKETVVAFNDINSIVSRICGRILSEKGAKVRYLDRSKQSYKRFSELRSICKNRISVTSSMKELISGSKIVINTLLFASQEFIDNLSSGSLLFDAILPFNVSRVITSLNRNIKAYESAWVSRGSLNHKGFDLIFPPDAIPACIAEAAMLGLESRIDRFSRINRSNALALGEIGKENGVYFSKLYLSRI